jgi:type II restriction enzyme
MNLNLNTFLGDTYASNSQIARVVTESWVEHNAFCPSCANDAISRLPNNTPVADFSCSKCKKIFELKSKHGAFPKKVMGGAYDAMIERITSSTNPDFFFMSYDRASGIVKDLLVIPKRFLVPAIIEKRNPLKPSARRAGWIGCNILLASILLDGQIYLVKDGAITPKHEVIEQYRKTAFLDEVTLEMRGWLLDILNCINRLGSNEFTLTDLYRFENELMNRHSENNHVRAKIRQQLQILRDKHVIQFLSRGSYRRI